MPIPQKPNCPCGGPQPYSMCCQRKEISYVLDASGRIIWQSFAAEHEVANQERQPNALVASPLPVREGFSENDRDFLKAYPAIAECPCGSRLHYGQCCQATGKKYYLTYYGEIVTERLPERYKQIIEVIRGLKNRATANDVVARTGLPLAFVVSQLHRLAIEASGKLKVSTAGDIIYCFSEDLAREVRRDVSELARQAGKSIFKLGFYMLRLFACLLLLFSPLSLIGLPILFALGRGKYGEFGPYGSLYDVIFKLEWPPKESESGFAIKCLCFLFGSGNPNAVFEREKWLALSRAIRLNRGVMTAAQLSAYTGVDPEDQNAILPVLYRFDGHPQATESGNLVYVFPSLMVGTVDPSELSAIDPPLEQRWQFSNLSWESIAQIAAFVAGNIGVLLLMALAIICYHKWLSVLAIIFGIATIPFIIFLPIFVIVPAMRLLAIEAVNRSIKRRNECRLQYRDLLKNPSPELGKALIEANTYKEKFVTTGIGKTIYDTDRDMLEQEIEQL